MSQAEKDANFGDLNSFFAKILLYVRPVKENNARVQKNSTLCYRHRQRLKRKFNALKLVNRVFRREPYSVRSGNFV